MDARENEAGGETIVVQQGDDLEQVPKSHEHLLTPELRAAFRDPVAYFTKLIDRAPIPAMNRWLAQLVREKHCAVELHTSAWGGDEAAFDWRSEFVRGASIGLPKSVRPEFPVPILNQYYACVDQVHWMGFGCAGGLEGCNDQPTVHTVYHSMEWDGAEVDPQLAHVLGWGPGGDVMFFTPDDRGGWVSHETGKVHFLGTVAETLSWIFEELLADRVPDFSSEWY